ncbi:MAG: hypothetical protein CMQ20_17730 [Gammaproteobacteria bacterium]|jgi:hypothetical protein|nr:hypothetical protein [Gammaproteobacteria bacterium]|tara:strand:+ start:1458 stop:1892 length:435 start_codon:yes stop_codon:yes gene_type:complete
MVTLLAACSSGTPNVPEEGPDVVASRFYEYISEAKLRGGAAPARAAYKLINADSSKLNQSQFVEIIKRYPPGFRVELTGTEIDSDDSDKALVTIVYKMPSDFGDYSVNGEVSLDLDPHTNSWKIDFTGENHGLGRADLVGAGGD